jgi:hypothetical protein
METLMGHGLNTLLEVWVLLLALYVATHLTWLNAIAV